MVKVLNFVEEGSYGEPPMRHTIVCNVKSQDLDLGVAFGNLKGAADDFENDGIAEGIGELAKEFCNEEYLEQNYYGNGWHGKLDAIAEFLAEKGFLDVIEATPDTIYVY